MASFRHLARGQPREWGWGPEPLSFEISVVVKKCKAVALVNWFKPTCFKSAKKPEIFQFGSMDHFNYVDTVFPSQKFVQVEGFLLLVLPNVSLTPGQRAGSCEEGCGDCSPLRVPWRSVVLSSATVPARGLLGRAVAPPRGWAKPGSGSGPGYNVPAAEPVWGSRRRLGLEMAARQGAGGACPPALSSGREQAGLQQAPASTLGGMVQAWRGYAHPDRPCSPSTEHTSWNSSFLY